MKFIAQQLIGATVVFVGVHIATKSMDLSAGVTLVALGLSILLERVR